MKLAPSLNDPMRERRSAALQAYLTSQRDNTGALIYGDARLICGDGRLICDCPGATVCRENGDKGGTWMQCFATR